MKKIPYARQWISEEDISAVAEVMRGDWLTTGPMVEKFEQEIAKYVGVKYAVAVNSGTSALDIAVGAMELPKKSEIITTAFSFAASSNCILYNNHTPVFADIDPDTFNINPDEIKKKITEKTKAIIYVDYAGEPCEIDEIMEIASEHGLLLIDDAAHALGAEYHGKKVGRFADMTEFSFHPVKQITSGEGGMVVTNNEEFAAKLRMLRNHGIDKTPGERKGYAYNMKMLGKNYRIADIQCALGISQLKKIELFLQRREEIAKKYSEVFSKVPGITPQKLEDGVRHAWHLYPVLVENMERDLFFSKMRENGVEVNVHYLPIYSFEYYQKMGYRSLPVTDKVSSKIVSLPMFPKMEDTEVNKVIETVKKIMK